jgi:integrase
VTWIAPACPCRLHALRGVHGVAPDVVDELVPSDHPRDHGARVKSDAELPHISLYEGTKHSVATDAIRRGVTERHLQRFLGHKNVPSTRRYARLADNALFEVLRSSKTPWRQGCRD